ncbi:MAG: L-threonylcarbamoyladenylate synthase [Candidatus Jordarchaeum sp.]|uniref:L-threonylcarbamoyladenylate synthase n=1 Tax=Candidatus Jordarchaeum sp. TaxID=2823881 RepID=UPI0040496D0C
MRIIKVEPEKPNMEIIREAGKLLREGRLVAYPTDTVYGLGTNPFDIHAVKNLLRVKKRDRELGLPILVSDEIVARRVAEFTPEAEILSRNFWPGALTLVLKTSIKIPSIVTGSRKNIAIRLPSHKVPQLLAKYLDGILIGTSANISGKPPALNAHQVQEQIGRDVDMILDSGETLCEKPSTIVDLTQKPPIILREGKISQQSLKKVISLK